MKAAVLAAFFTVPAVAGTYWHPWTNEVAIAGPEEATVCYYTSGTQTSADNGEQWVCGVFDLFGAKEPVVIAFPQVGPVKVIDARWAYAAEDGSWVPMSKD